MVRAMAFLILYWLYFSSFFSFSMPVNGSLLSDAKRIRRMGLSAALPTNTNSKTEEYDTICTNSTESGASKYEKLMKYGHWNFRKIIAYQGNHGAL